MLDLAFAVFAALDVKIVEQPDGDPVWVTAAVGFGGDILGAVVGGFASYFGNRAIETHRREVRQKTRTSAKVYAPLKRSLTTFRDQLAGPAQFRWAIATERDQTEHNQLVPSFTLWNEMVEDGRATYASGAVESSLGRLSTAIGNFNQAHEDALKTLADAGEDIIGADVRYIGWEHSLLPALLTDDPSEFLWRPHSLGGGSVEQGEQRERLDAIRRNLDSVEGWEASVAALQRADRHLNAAVTQALATLESSIAHIAKKYERADKKE